MSRRDIHYWKCDRPAAFHGTAEREHIDPQVETQLREALVRSFNPKTLSLSPGAGQGNHRTWNADADGVAMFVRVENGPENDAHLAVESAVLDEVRAVGVPTPRVFGCDASRRGVPFAWQALERVPHPDLNQWFKKGELETSNIAFEIGVAVARWQDLMLPGFGPLHFADKRAGNIGRVWLQPARRGAGVEMVSEDGEHSDTGEPGGPAVDIVMLSELNAPDTPGLRAGGSAAMAGYHERYEDYFCLRLDEHLAFLVRRGFLSADQRAEIEAEIEHHRELLVPKRGCLVHKDLALWNILGSPDRIVAFIDFDDAISGDPTDDLSLLACFHDDAFVSRAIEGYQTVRALPENFRRRFWLHLLRNMIVKAVIRVGAGYFERDSGFFLIGSGSSGADLRRFTMERLQRALRSLRENEEIGEK